MSALLRRGAAFYRAHPIKVMVALFASSLVLLLPIGGELQAREWPQQWSFHHRVQFQRFEHAVPLFTYSEGGSRQFVPYLGRPTKALRSGDSISKQLHADRLYLIRDSTNY